MASAREVARNPVKEKLARGEVVVSMALRMVGGVEMVRIAKSAGFDTLYVDLEHSALSLQDTSQLSIMGLEAGIPVLVRVPACTPDYVSRAMDGGALGIIAPDVRSAADAKRVVDAVKYPPVGSRGLAQGLPLLQYRSFPQEEALPAMNDATMVVVQVESGAAAEAMEEIVAVPGVDLVLIGTNDFLADLGLPGQYDHPRVEELYKRAIACCRKHGKHVGVGGFGTRPDLVEKYVKLGGRYVSTGTDLGFMAAECDRRVKQVRDIKL